MRRVAIATVFTALACGAQTAPPHPDAGARVQTAAAGSTSSIVVPAGTTVSVAVTAPVWSRTVKPGDAVYTATTFPVALNNQMAIPAGTYVQGEIDSLKKPAWLSQHAEILIHFTKFIFADGYSVELSGPQAATTLQPPPADDVIPAVADAYVQVTSANDILLDNGTQLEMVLQVPIALDAARIAAAVGRPNSVKLAAFKSATKCRPTPGTPGTPDTVIPGTPGSPGTPDTVIPGGPGMPDTVIPGIPATPGTPATIIPGSPGFPGTTCPGPPVVTINPKPQKYKENYQISTLVQVGGQQLSPGTYQVSWAGSGPTTDVEFLMGKTVVARVPARVVLLNGKSPVSVPETLANSDGSLSLQSMRFAGQTMALYFDPRAT
jgi:hypothetical protein